LADQNFLVGHRKIVDNLPAVIIIHDRTHRNLNQQVISVLAVTLAPETMLATFRVKETVIPKLNQGVVAQGGLDVHVATAPAIASAGSASRDELFSPKGHATATSVARSELDSCLIQKHIIPRSAGCLIVPPKANPLSSGTLVQ
jgi:hypothetical protein